MIRIDVKKTDFYNELPKEKQREYFGCCRAKFLPNIDNIYYTVSVEGDSSDSPRIKAIIQKISGIKETVLKNRESRPYGHGLYVDYRTFTLYKYCLSKTDLYDIFILDYLPTADTPRMVVQIRSYGLWLYGWQKMLDMSLESVEAVLGECGCAVSQCRENRIDYCFHTNAIQNPERHFSERSICGTMFTTMERYHFTGRTFRLSKAVLHKDYFALGERKSNYVFIRFYNKSLEVIEKGYKAYFFEIWHRNGLISFYDKYCFEYAYKEKNYDCIHKARLQFYLDYGSDRAVKKEFSLALSDKKMTLKKYRALADAYMPGITTVMNCEFETKRKFYYLSDRQIDGLKLPPATAASVAPVFHRLYKVLLFRDSFIDFLTDTTLKFAKKDGSYCDWWKRLRSAAIDGIKVDGKLERDYSNSLDFELMKRRFVNAIAGMAVYGGMKGTTFIEDITDALSNINDNDRYGVQLSYFSSDDGEIGTVFESSLLQTYEYKKEVREKRIKNRKELF